LGGHTLAGDQSGSSYGIDDTGGFDNVTVRHGTVTKFDYGVYGIDTDGMHVQGVVLSGNTGDGILISGASARVASSQASGNSLSGIEISGASARVASSRASSNGLNGIDITGGSVRVTSSQA